MSEFSGLFRPASLEPFYTAERCYITEKMNSDLSPDVSLAECRVAPGVTTQLHKLTVAERYVIQQGHGLVELNGEAGFSVAPADCVLIPAGCAQRIKNTGHEDLVFMCVCTPRFLPDCYVVLEDAQTKDIVEQ